MVWHLLCWGAVGVDLWFGWGLAGVLLLGCVSFAVVLLRFGCGVAGGWLVFCGCFLLVVLGVGWGLAGVLLVFCLALLWFGSAFAVVVFGFAWFCFGSSSGAVKSMQGSSRNSI